MADDKTKQDNRDRSRVAGDQDYEVKHLATKHNIASETIAKSSIGKRPE
jgi:hypothetical protein